MCNGFVDLVYLAGLGAIVFFVRDYLIIVKIVHSLLFSSERAQPTIISVENLISF